MSERLANRIILLTCFLSVIIAHIIINYCNIEQYGIEPLHVVLLGFAAMFTAAVICTNKIKQEEKSDDDE